MNPLLAVSAIKNGIKLGKFLIELDYKEVTLCLINGSAHNIYVAIYSPQFQPASSLGWLRLQKGQNFGFNLKISRRKDFPIFLHARTAGGRRVWGEERYWFHVGLPMEGKLQHDEDGNALNAFVIHRATTESPVIIGKESVKSGRTEKVGGYFLLISENRTFTFK